MALDVSSIQVNSIPSSDIARHAQGAQGASLAAQAAALPRDLKTAIRDLQSVSDSYNRRLAFSLNEKLGQVVIKVIDTDTDKVLREIPPTELQHVYERIREAAGLLVDKSA